MILKYLTIIIISALVTYFLYWPVVKLGSFFRIFDKANLRDNSSKRIVRIGGLALFLGFLISILISYWFGWLDLINSKFIYFSLIGSFLVFLIGLIDDIWSISPFPRLIFQALIGAFFWQNLLKIKVIDLSIFPFLGRYDLPPFLSLLITTFLIVAIINSFNWQDGLDGLCSGVNFISSVGFALVIFAISNHSIEIIYILTIVGVCLGFLFHNYNPAKIFMGDSGSYFLGLNSAIFVCTTYEKLLYSNYSKYSIFIPICILFLPLMDMAYVIFSRLWEGRSPFFPDTRHFHYKLIKIGVSHSESVQICYVLNQFFSLSVLGFIFVQYRLLLTVSFSLLALFLFKKSKKINVWYENFKHRKLIRK